MAERRLFQDIADRIATMIAEGGYPPGARLPGERELAERFEVSRVTVREAEIALQATGLIRIKTGAGVFVADAPAADALALPDVSAFELTEARSLFESEAAALAAPIIAADQLERLDTLLAAMADDKDEVRLTETDREFHMTIASASGNKAIIHVIETLWRMRTELPAIETAHQSVCRNDAAARQREHAAIVRALHARDPAGARLAMRQHFSRLLRAMLDETEQREVMELKRRTDASRARFLMSASLA